jgi:hypothetical protein
MPVAVIVQRKKRPRKFDGIRPDIFGSWQCTMVAGHAS